MEKFKQFCWIFLGSLDCLNSNHQCCHNRTQPMFLFKKIIRWNYLPLDIAKLQKRHSLSSEMKATAIIEFFTNFINSGCMYLMMMDVRIFVSVFGLESSNFINGTYQDFNVLWYGDIGAAITLTMFLNVFMPHVSNILLMVYRLCIRWRDRCMINDFFIVMIWLDFTMDMSKTKQVLQEDYEKIYIGPHFWTEYHYALVFFLLTSFNHF